MALHERTMKNVTRHDLSLWDYIKELVEYVELDTIQELIGNDVILNNEILLNEVFSLREILRQMKQDSAETEKHPDGNSHRGRVQKEPSLREWSLDVIIQRVSDLLQVLGEDGTKLLYTPQHADLADYFRDVKEGGGGRDLKCNSNAEHSSREELKASRPACPTAIDHFERVYRIREELNVFGISDVLPIILKAFTDEEAELKMKADHLRKFIDAEARSSCNVDLEGKWTHNKKPSLEAIVKLQSSLEQIREEKDLIDRNRKERILPPLNNDAYPLATLSLSQMCSKNNAIRKSSIDASCKECPELQQQQWQRQRQCKRHDDSKSKKRMMLHKVLDDAKKLGSI